jgi:hypothetical protein
LPAPLARTIRYKLPLNPQRQELTLSASTTTGPHIVAANIDMRLLRDKSKKRLYIMLAAVGFGAQCGVANAVDVGVGINVGTPVVVAPAPVVVASPGWQGDRYWDGRRYWDRDEWEEHHHHHHDHDHGHCPPGHAKKGEC